MIFRDRFLRNSVIIFISTAIVNIANLLCQIIIVKKLTVESYGAFNSLLSIFTVVAIPIGSIATMVAKFSAAYNTKGERKKADFFIFVLGRHMFLAGVFFLILYLIFGFNFKRYLNLDSVIPVYLTGAMLFLTIISTLLSGGLQGLEKFLWFGAGSVLITILKLALIFLFLILGYGLIGVLSSYLIVQITGIAIGLFALKEIFYLKNEAYDIDITGKYKFIVPSVLTLGAIAALTNMDIILVKHFFRPIEAGYYSVAQLIGKIALFIPSAIYVVMLPTTSGLHALEKDTRSLLKKSLKYTAILCLLFAGFYNIFPAFILNLLTGKCGDDIIFLGRLFSVAMTFFSFLVVLLLYQLSISRFTFLKTLILFTLLQVLAILFFHASLTQVLLIVLLNSFILFALNLRLCLKGS